MTDSELEELCRQTLNDEENRFAVVLYRRGKSSLGFLVSRVYRQVPKAEMTNDLLVKSHQILARLLDDTTN